MLSRCTGAVRWSWVVLLLLVMGCGVTEYENRMVRAQYRWQRYEEENRYLDDPLILPSREDKAGGKLILPPSIFLRPPKGISSQPENPNDPRARLLYSYRPKQAKTDTFLLVELAVSEGNERFRDEVLGSFGAAGNRTSKQRKVNPPGREPLTFDTIEFEDGQTFYSVNFYRVKPQDAVVVYWVKQTQKAQSQRILELSLGTFALGLEADRRRQYGGRSPLDVPGHGS